MAVLLLILAGVAGPAGAERPTAATVLRRADLVRNPSLGTAFDVELSVVSRSSGRQLRASRFTVLTHRGGRTLLLMPSEERSSPAAVLIADDAYWLLLPHSDRPVELALRHVVSGDLSHAGFLRFALWARFEARHAGEETVGDAPCWRLDLEAAAEDDSGVELPAAPFERVRYWVTRRGFLPIRIEFYAPDGSLLKTARFTRYRDTAVGRRPARIEIEDAGRPKERSILTLSVPRGVPTSRLDFDLDDLRVLRDAARRLAVEGEAPVTGRRLVRALRAAERAGHGEAADPR